MTGTTTSSANSCQGSIMASFYSPDRRLECGDEKKADKDRSHCCVSPVRHYCGTGVVCGRAVLFRNRTDRKLPFAYRAERFFRLAILARSRPPLLSHGSVSLAPRVTRQPGINAFYRV